MNTDALILGPTGRPLFKIGDVAHAQFRAGDYDVSIEWLTAGRECEPVMLIWSPSSRDGGVFGICLSSIGKYAEPSGGPSREAFLECWKALPMLGRAQIDMEVNHLIDLILRHTPDLIRCPPMPPAMRRAEAGEALMEVKQVVNGKTHSEAVI
ncbi:MAG: hypothetical protein H0W48_00075 [Methylibium sp.]|nr:hypothetical protein [Methylibium sp.]